MKNRTQFVSVDTFDSTVPEDAVQYVTTARETFSPYSNGFLLSQLRLHGKLSRKTVKKFTFEVHVRIGDVKTDTSSKIESSFCDYDISLASGSYIYDTSTNMASIGLIRVQEKLEGNGIGLQIKKQLHNIMRQDGITMCYTLPVSESGVDLALKTGYRPDMKLSSPSYKEIIYSRSI